MFTIVTLIAVFVMISIYLYFRAENLQSQLTRLTRECKQIKNENSNIIDAMIISANKNEEFAQFRLQEMKDSLDSQLTSTLSHEIELLTVLTANYSAIYIECLKGESDLKTITKRCLDAYSKETYTSFNYFISNQDAALKKMWLTNNFQGFIALIEALLLQFNKKIKA